MSLGAKSLQIDFVAHYILFSRAVLPFNFEKFMQYGTSEGPSIKIVLAIACTQYATFLDTSDATKWWFIGVNLKLTKAKSVYYNMIFRIYNIKWLYENKIYVYKIISL